MKKTILTILVLALLMAGFIGCSGPNDPTPETVADITDSQTGNTITLATATEGSAIYYTIDGSVPTAKKTLYTAIGIEITQNTTIKAIAIKEGWYDSPVFSKAFTYTPSTVADITDSRSGNTITLTTTTSGASIYYTTDGSSPTAEKTLYSGAITLDYPGTVNIKAIAIKTGAFDSGVFTKSYEAFQILDKPEASISWAKVTLTAGSGTSIYYSIDGSTPTIPYTEPVTVKTNTNVKAIAKKTGFIDSEVFSGNFTAKYERYKDFEGLTEAQFNEAKLDLVGFTDSFKDTVTFHGPYANPEGDLTFAQFGVASEKIVLKVEPYALFKTTGRAGDIYGIYYVCNRDE
jgi:hypothetical protein